MNNKATQGKDLLSVILRGITVAAAVITGVTVAIIVGYILIKGIPSIDSSLFALNYTSDNQSLTTSFINTVLMTALALVIAVPLGVGAAIYLTEYTRNSGKLVTLIRYAAETLAGIPSIVYGLFGMLFFVVSLRMGFSLLAGSLTIAIMVLPTIMRTSEEALLSVPMQYREGAFALGAGKLRTVFRVILPAASSGILSGMILAIGRIVGESAALIFTAGTVAEFPTSVFSSTRTLSVHMYSLASEGLHIDKAYATAVVLLALVAIINAAALLVMRRITKGRQHL
ncbi:MAG: phosphate ABC transporter permease PstA [Bifidobacteriaceae bacterium]|jgi:phosphate transport system permease protein|nr:phosphate ABC transporter permease PstA [Bifidobacteriaceae bacterium]